MWWWVAGIVLGANVAHAKKDPLEKVEDLCKGLSFDQRPRLEAGSFASQVAAPPVLPSRLNAMLTMGMLSTGCFSMRVTTQGEAPEPEPGPRYQIRGIVTEFTQTQANKAVQMTVNGQPWHSHAVRLGLLVELVELTGNRVVANDSVLVKQKAAGPLVDDDQLNQAAERAVKLAVVEMVELLAHNRQEMLAEVN